ncbi:hypothetical protein [Posidoniimonas polymericola]|nr:hypothetical protein [Posidoniimonas polymericola]
MLGLLALTAAFGVAGSASAQLLFSFESGLDGWVGPTSAGPYINHFQTTTGATEGAMAMGVETSYDFGRGARVSLSTGPVYDIFNQVSADPSLYTLDFDITFTESSWTQVSDVGTYFLFSVFSNSDAAVGFEEVNNIVNASPGVAGSYHLTMPASQLSLTPDSSYYQLGVTTNSNHFNADTNVGVTYYLDNFRFTEVPQYVETTLFSWETPDNPSTPGVDERFEGWQDGFSNAPYQHTRTITSSGATDGANALGVGSPQAGFAWGSQFAIDASVETGDPALQPLVDQLITEVNKAEILALDVTFGDDPFPASPTYESITLNLSDFTGAFYQATQNAGDPTDLAGQTVTLEFPLSSFIASGVSLPAAGGLQPGGFFRLALGTNSDDAVDISIDNVRLLAPEFAGLAGDYNDDGVVDAADYTIWRDNVGASAGTLPNDPNSVAIGQAQYATWVANFAAGGPSSSAEAAPEPGSLALCLLLAGSLAMRLRHPSA